MLEQMINASSRPGDLSADFFMGSGFGLTVKAALAPPGAGREDERFIQTGSEIKQKIIRADK